MQFENYIFVKIKKNIRPFAYKLTIKLLKLLSPLIRIHNSLRWLNTIWKVVDGYPEWCYFRLVVGANFKFGMDIKYFYDIAL